MKENKFYELKWPEHESGTRVLAFTLKVLGEGMCEVIVFFFGEKGDEKKDCPLRINLVKVSIVQEFEDIGDMYMRLLELRGQDALGAIQGMIDFSKACIPLFNENELSDGYHTFDELYEFRKVYNSVLFNEWAKTGKYDVHKSWRHNDGEECFPSAHHRWFIVSAMLPSGLISNHYKEDDWDLFKVPEVEKALFEFDGHDGGDVLKRLKQIGQQCTCDSPTLQEGTRKCGECERYIDRVRHLELMITEVDFECICGTPITTENYCPSCGCEIEK